MDQIDPMGYGDGDRVDPDAELLRLLVDQQIQNIEYNEEDLKHRGLEDKITSLLLDDDWPLLKEALVVRAQLGVESGLIELYEHLAIKGAEIRQMLTSAGAPEEGLRQQYYTVNQQSGLVATIMQLAAAKGLQEFMLATAQEEETIGGSQLVSYWREQQLVSYWREQGLGVRKEAEARVLLEESLDEAQAVRLLEVVAAEFEGESLLPLTAQSRRYIMMQWLEEEVSSQRTQDRRQDLSNLISIAQEKLAAKFSSGQRQHPDFESFSSALSYAIAHEVQALQNPEHFSPEELQVKSMTSKYHVAKAKALAPQLGIDADSVQDIYEDTVAQLS